MNNKHYRLVAALVLVILSTIFLVSACNFDSLLGGTSNQAADAPTQSRIVTPADQTQVVVNSPVQIQSEHTEQNIARVELLINNELQRADIPTNGRVLQAWTPKEAGAYTIAVRAFDDQNNPLSNPPGVQVVVLTDEVVRVVEDAPPPAPPQPAATTESFAQSDPQTSDSADSAFRLQQQVCEFGSAGAPVLSQFDIGGYGDVIAQSEETPIDLPTEVGQDLIIDWNVINAENFVVNIENPVGNIQTITSINATERVLYTPQSPGQYTITFNARNPQCSSTLTRQVTVGAIVLPTATPTPVAAAAAPMLAPTPTPTAFYPPPPAAPGVPPGPTQEELPELMPPVCDAAKFVDVYIPNTSERITITEPDKISAKTVGGTLVHRAWRVQNIGTCTWGPGYELAFYGGRSMGSGGVAFESFFPNEPSRRNIVVSTERLIAPEGRPNEIAVLELLLNAPVTPGIHQSYWRMRNPQGVYFGPILGVTLEVVRECRFGIYGAPVINRFEILGVGDVFRPQNPIEVEAELGEPVTLDWSIINADNYDIVVKGPTGSTANLSTSSRTDRNSFIPNQVGQYIITIYADNGPCTASADVTVNVVPNDDDFSSFRLDIIRGAGNELTMSWNHLDPDVDNVVMVAERWERTKGTECLFGLNNLWSTLDAIICQDNQWSEWRRVPGEPLPVEIVSVAGPDQPAEIGGASADVIAAQDAVVVGNQTVVEGSRVSVAREVGQSSQGVATVSNVEWGLCPAVFASDDSTRTQDVGIRLQLRAQKDSSAASPAWSNTVDIRCGAAITSQTGGDAGSAANRPSPDFSPD